MKILAVNLRPDITQIVEGKIKKEILIIDRIDTYDSIYGILEAFGQESVNDFFTKLLARVKNKKAAAYFGICDQIIRKINCGERDYVQPEDWDKTVSDWIPQFLQMEKSNLYFAAPIHLKKRNKSIITGMAVSATYINLIFEAAVVAGINIKSIEPACCSLLRFLNRWDKEYCIMEIWENKTSITGYSPIRGMFKIDSPVGWTEYLKNENGRDELSRNIVTHDYAAYTTYKIANTNIPIYFVSDKLSELRKLILPDEISARLQNFSRFSQEFIFPKLSPEENALFGTALGLALTPLHERMIENANSFG